MQGFIEDSTSASSRNGHDPRAARHRKPTRVWVKTADEMLSQVNSTSCGDARRWHSCSLRGPRLRHAGQTVPRSHALQRRWRQKCARMGSCRREGVGRTCRGRAFAAACRFGGHLAGADRTTGRPIEFGIIGKRGGAWQLSQGPRTSRRDRAGSMR